MLQVDWKMLTPLRFVTLLTALVWPLTALPQTQAASAIVTIAPDPATLMVAPGQGSAAGQIHVTVAGAALSDITLYASPLTLGDQHAFVSFEASKTDTIRLDDSRLQCQANKDCTVHILVRDAWGSGVFQGKIDAFSAQGKVGSTPIASVRAGAAFQPVITSDALHDGRLVFDATASDSFLLHVQNPAGAPPQKLTLSSALSAAGCETPVSFTPSELDLEPGAQRTVVTKVNPCVKGTQFAVLRIATAQTPPATSETVISLSKYSPWRKGILLFVVVIGAVVSLLLNNIFPVNRQKNALRNDLRRAEELLLGCTNAGAGLINGLRAEATRLGYALQAIHFYDAGKTSGIQETQRAVAVLAAAAALAHRISLLRAKADGAIVSIATHAQIRRQLREAEDSLLAGDQNSAAERLTDALTTLTAATNDVGQAALRKALDGNVLKLMKERGTLLQQAAAAQAGHAGDAPPRPGLTQRQDRHPRIAALIDQLWTDYPDLGELTAQEILDVERDYYIADIWTEYVEPRLDIFSDGQLSGRQAAMRHLADALLESLFRNPKSDNTQLLLDLLRGDLMPDEIAASLAAGEARIDCDRMPKYLEPLDIAFVFTNPLINDVPAARRLLTYTWVIDHSNAQLPNVDRFRYYFRHPDRVWRLPWAAAPDHTQTLSATVRTPFTDAAPITLGPLTLRLRRPPSTWWRVEPMEVASFLVTLAIATVSAFGTQYATSLPNVITWSDWVSAFLFGFGLDQLRDTVSTPANSTTTAGGHPPPTPAPAAAHTA